MKIPSPLRRLLAVLAVVLPAALVAPNTAVAACNVPLEELQCPDFSVPEDGTAKTGQKITFVVISPSPDVTYLWDTNGDGVPSEGEDASATYDQPGDKTVTLRAVSNADTSKFNETTKQFTVTDPDPPPPVNKPPVADFSVRGTRVVGQPITLTSTSSDPDGTIVNYTWTADGGAPLFKDAGAMSTTVTFGEAGTHRVTLRVVDDQGAPATRTRRIVVGSAPPPPNQPPNIPSFSFTPERPSANEVVRFTATASDPDGTIETIEWDFDNDGIVDASGTSVKRVFTTGGTATVTVIVTDDRGGQRKSFQTIIVSGPSSNGTAESKGNETKAQTGTNVNIGTTINNTNTNKNTTSIRLISPIIRLRGAISGGRTRITLLRVYGVPRGAKVRARCRGGGCPKGMVTNTAQTSGRSIRLKAFERTLRPGATIEVYVTQTGRLGKYTKWRVNRAKAPSRTDKCLRAFGKKPSRCPTEA